MTASSGDVTVPGLLRLARDNAEITRRTYAALGAALVDGGPADVTLTDWQRSILSQLLRQVIGDIFSSMRWLILASVEDNADTGREPWSNFAPDSEARVYSHMMERGLLTDVALIEAITHRLFQHQLEQATRPPDRNRWTNEPTLDSPNDFFGRPVPEFSPVNRRIAAYVVDRSRRTDRYGNPVLLASEVELQLYERLHWRVAAVLRHMLVDEFGDRFQQLDARIETAAVETIRHSAAIAAAPTSAAEASRALEAADLLTIDTVYRLLRAGEIPLFEETFARLAGIRPVLLRRLLYEAGGECFAVLARALDMDLDQTLSIYALTRSGRAQQIGEPNGGNDPLEAIYGTVSFDDANLVRAHWMREPDFSSALREAEPALPEDAKNTLH